MVFCSCEVQLGHVVDGLFHRLAEFLEASGNLIILGSLFLRGFQYADGIGEVRCLLNQARHPLFFAFAEENPLFKQGVDSCLLVGAFLCLARDICRGGRLA